MDSSTVAQHGDGYTIPVDATGVWQGEGKAVRGGSRHGTGPSPRPGQLPASLGDGTYRRGHHVSLVEVPSRNVVKVGWHSTRRA